MIGLASISGVPVSLRLRKLSFVSWYGEVVNFSESYKTPSPSYCFGYLFEGDDSKISVAGAVIEEPNNFSLETRSTIWRIAEINIERQNDWLIFSRPQDDLSLAALADFLIDSQNYLEHLRDEHKRFGPVKQTELERANGNFFTRNS